MAMLKNRLASSSGQSLVELTLVFPLMVLLLFGVVEVAQVIGVHQTMVHLTREGANLTSRGTDIDKSLAAIVSAAGPTITDANRNQWRVIYSQLRQQPGKVCPPKPCTYEVFSQTSLGDLAAASNLGTLKKSIAIGGMNDVEPNQIFHAIEVYYDHRPNVFSFVGKLFDTNFYERTIFTNVGALS
jgi:Flp pilus assembly protein TadG